MPDPDVSLVGLADRLVGSLVSASPSWPDDVPRAESVALEPLVVEGARAHAAGVVAAVAALPVAAVSAYDATFEARGAEVRLALSVVVDPTTGVVTVCRLALTSDEWPTAARTDLTDAREATL